MAITHRPATHPLPDGTIAVCCQDAWWCDNCGRLRHLAYDLCGVREAYCYPCLRTRDLDLAAQLRTIARANT